MKKFENLLMPLRYIASLGAYQIEIGNILWLMSVRLKTNQASHSL